MRFIWILTRFALFNPWAVAHRSVKKAIPVACVPTSHLRRSVRTQTLGGLLLQFSLMLLLLACNGGLTDEQKKAFKEEYDQREVKRVTPGELTEAVYHQGNVIADTLQQLFSEKDRQDDLWHTSVITAEDEPLLDSLNRKYKVHIKWIGAEAAGDTPSMVPLEKQLLDAYLYDTENGREVRENVQKIDEKSFLFTQPVLLSPTTESPKLWGMWSITLLSKEIILAL